MATSFNHWYYVVFISPRCLEPVVLTKKLAPNRIMSFGARWWLQGGELMGNCSKYFC